MSFATYLKNIRQENKETQVNMAKILGISVTAIKLIENGKTKFPSEKVLHSLCEYTHLEPIDVMTSILFDEQSIKEHYTINRYLAYMQLDGWNIDECPYIIPLIGTATRTFDAKITKKRANKNIQIVCNYDRFLERINIDSILKEKNTMDYISDAAALTLAILEPFKGLQIIFDANDEKQKTLLDLFEEEVYNQLKFDINCILFDPSKGQIMDTKQITK